MVVLPVAWAVVSRVVASVVPMAVITAQLPTTAVPWPASVAGSSKGTIALLSSVSAAGGVCPSRAPPVTAASALTKAAPSLSLAAGASAIAASPFAAAAAARQLPSAVVVAARRTLPFVAPRAIVASRVVIELLAVVGDACWRGSGGAGGGTAMLPVASWALSHDTRCPRGARRSRPASGGSSATATGVWVWVLGRRTPPRSRLLFLLRHLRPRSHLLLVRQRLFPPLAPAPLPSPNRRHCGRASDGRRRREHGRPAAAWCRNAAPESAG
jgi:hypothetical protein